MTCHDMVVLGDIATIIQGGRLKLSGKNFVSEGVPAYGAGGLNGYLAQAEFETPAVVLSSIGARCGKCFLAEGAWTSLANTQLIFPDPSKADVRYLWYQLNDEKRWHRSGTGQPFIKPSDVKGHRIYLPTLKVQRRIAATLGQADALRAKRREAIAKLDQLLQSEFVRLFGDISVNEAGWPEVEFGAITEAAKIGLVRGATEFGDEGHFNAPYIRMDAIGRNGEFFTERVKRTTATSREIDEFSVRYGDLLINTRNSKELVGKAAVFELDSPWTFNNNLMRVRFGQRANPFYVLRYLLSSRGKMELEKRKSGTTNVFAVYYKDLQNLPVVLPPMELQDQFQRVVECLRKSRLKMHESARRTDALFAALSEAAFAGRL